MGTLDFKVTVSEAQLSALEAAAQTCIDQWDGMEPEDIKQKDDLREALSALHKAEAIR